MTPWVQAVPRPHSRSEVRVGGAVWCWLAAQSWTTSPQIRLDEMVGGTVWKLIPMRQTVRLRQLARVAWLLM